MAEIKLPLEECYAARGPEDGIPLVLIHGSVVSKESWLPQLEELSDTYRVIAVDLPGHGSLAGFHFSYQYASQILADVIRRETDQPAVVAGLSLGGYAAIEFSAAYPELVRGLILSGCRPRLKGPLALYLRTMGRLMKIGWLKADRQQAERRILKMYSRELREAAEIQIAVGVFPEALGDVFLEMAGKDYAARLKSSTRSAFLLNGELDRDSRRGEKGFLRTYPLVKLKVIPGAGHALSLDQPRLYNAAVRGILQQFSAARSTF